MLEIDAVGARGLKPFGILNRLEGKHCYVAMDCGGGDTFYVHSKAQAIDADCGANFYERLRLPVKFPLSDPYKFAPHLTLRIFASDGSPSAPKRLRKDTLIGFASVPMLYNIPWANAGRRPRINKPVHALTVSICLCVSARRVCCCSWRVLARSLSSKLDKQWLTHTCDMGGGCVDCERGGADAGGH